MSEEPIAFFRAEARAARIIPWTSGPSSGGSTAAREVRFDRRELNQILGVYSRMVSAGAWRDYAIDFLSDRAVFSIFRRTSEVPLYKIVKQPKLAAKQGQYAVIAVAGDILKRGHELPAVLRVFDKKLLRALASG